MIARKKLACIFVLSLVFAKAQRDTGSITYLNGVNFDFDNKTGANYVGLFKVQCPELKSWSIGKSGNYNAGFGIVTGLMKTNFAKSGDSINTITEYEENALLNPLDTVRAGQKFLRQYNQKDIISKNTTFSFYAQPMLGLYLGNDRRLSVLGHAHIELFASKWSYEGKINNLQQDTAFINNVDVNYSKVNKFKKSTDVPVSVNSVSSDVFYYYGGGVTFIIKPWRGAEIFLQPTWGRVGNTKRKKDPAKMTESEKEEEEKFGKLNFYLTRVSLNQSFNDNVAVVLGTEFRGLYSSKNGEAYSLLYSCYFGININMAGLRKLLN
jgi:hypothetical protein